MSNPATNSTRFTTFALVLVACVTLLGAGLVIIYVVDKLGGERSPPNGVHTQDSLPTAPGPDNSVRTLQSRPAP